MTIKELIDAINAHRIDLNARIELANGDTVDDLCYNVGQARLALSTMDERIEDDKLAKDWRYIVKH